MAAEAEQGEGDQGLGGLEPKGDSGDQADLGVGRLDQAARSHRQLHAFAMIWVK